jgi:hypothetical protein
VSHSHLIVCHSCSTDMRLHSFRVFNATRGPAGPAEERPVLGSQSFSNPACGRAPPPYSSPTRPLRDTCCCLLYISTSTAFRLVQPIEVCPRSSLVGRLQTGIHPYLNMRSGMCRLSGCADSGAVQMHCSIVQILVDEQTGQTADKSSVPPFIAFNLRQLLHNGWPGYAQAPLPRDGNALANHCRASSLAHCS